jgi:hypothetical protein
MEEWIEALMAPMIDLAKPGGGGGGTSSTHGNIVNMGTDGDGDDDDDEDEDEG